MDRRGFAVQFVSRYTGYACFVDWLCQRGVCGLRSTNSFLEIAIWPTREAAAEWLQQRHGFREGDAVPIGIGHMTIGIRPLNVSELTEADRAWIRGSLFEFPLTLPIERTPEQPAARSKPIQTAFAFGD